MTPGEVHDGEELVGASYVEGVVIDWSFVRANLERADFFYAWGGGANFDLADLKEATFSKANLVGATFDRAQAQGARFVKSDLSDATFVDANLEGADLRRAYLQGTSFERANLRGASFEHAKICNANFQGADLTGAYFSGALFEDDVRFADIKGFTSIDLASMWLDGTQIHGAGAHLWLFERVARQCLDREELERFFANELADAPVSSSVIAHSLPLLISRFDFDHALGAPLATQTIDGTVRREYVLSRWPALRFVVSTAGATCTMEFVGPWTVSGLRAAGVTLENEEAWGDDLDADIVVDGALYRAKFRYGLLVALARRSQ